MRLITEDCNINGQELIKCMFRLVTLIAAELNIEETQRILQDSGIKAVIDREV